MNVESHTPPSGDEEARAREAASDTNDEGTTPTADRAARSRRRKERHRAVPLSHEVRFFAPTGIEIRREARQDTDEIIITGSPIVYDAPYRVVDLFGEFEERMKPGCVADLL